MISMTHSVPIMLAAALSLLAGATRAESGPFTALNGTWSGGGTVTMASGMQDRLRCRANYTPGRGGEQLRLNIRCASDNYNFDLSSDVTSRNGQISGEWIEASHNASGTVIGRASGERVQAHARGDAFSADLSLTTRGNRQSVAIRPQGTEVRQVSLALNRR
jgi:hypothetical protein